MAGPQTAYNKGYQNLLELASAEERDEFAFSFDPNVYPANSLYQGSYKFSRHFYLNRAR
jgi:type III restriction enzyme